MQELYRQIIQDRNKDAYLVIVEGESKNYMESNLYPIRKINGEFLLDERSIGLCLFEKKDEKIYETLYSVDDDYQGRGIGAELIEFSKDLSVKFGAETIRIQKLERMIESPIIKGFYYDANLIMYLNHGFKLDLTNCSQKVMMICDLVEETNLSNDDLMRLRLKNKQEAFKVLTQSNEKK